jgi:hypothetical protein
VSVGHSALRTQGALIKTARQAAGPRALVLRSVRVVSDLFASLGAALSYQALLRFPHPSCVCPVYWTDPPLVNPFRSVLSESFCVWLPTHPCWSPDGDAGIRTPDFLLAKQALSH